MDSPQSDSNITPSPTSQDSSLSNYLSTLSPISANQLTEVQQPPSATDVRPSSSVFSSPRLNPQRGTSSLERPQYVNSPAADLSLEYDDNVSVVAAVPDVCQPYERTPASPADSEARRTFHADPYTLSKNNRAVNVSHHSSSWLSCCPQETLEIHTDNNDTSVQNNISSFVPSGIGLHLNSIGIANVVGCGSRIHLARKDDSSSSREKLPSGSNHHISEDSEGWLIPHEKQRPTAQDIHNLEEFGQMSPKNKRKRDLDAVANEGCKRCNCRKSRCLKLYCDCFAAGVYCDEPCTCLDCFNRLDYEDTVLATRQLIESRNPLAFAPKIVRRAIEFPKKSAEDDNRRELASSRHKRGCNCKKSKCLKKYCECYQAGVGCSGGCRCQGCENAFGKKEEMEHKEAGNERWEDASDGNLGIDILPEQHRLLMSPLTPMYQFENHQRDVPDSQHPTRRRLASTPESDIPFLSHYGIIPQSPQTSDGDYSLMKVQGNAGLVLNDHELSYQIGEKVYPFTPSWDGLSDIHDLTMSQNHPSLGASASTASDPIYSSKDLRPELSQESGSSSPGSLHWHSSPITPNVHLRGSKFVRDPDFDNKLYNILEDETFDALKETHSPIKAMKTSSPKQKHASPPHNCLHELRGTSSSPSLRGGRKFILQSIPSFPPLSPYSKPVKSEK